MDPRAEKTRDFRRKGFGNPAKWNRVYRRKGGYMELYKLLGEAVRSQLNHTRTELKQAERDSFKKAKEEAARRAEARKARKAERGWKKVSAPEKPSKEYTIRGSTFTKDQLKELDAEMLSRGEG
jgi:hypothetical protein